MKFDQILIRSSRLGLSFMMLLGLHASPSLASSTASGDAGLLPIEKSKVNKSLMDDLFGPQKDNNPSNNRANNNPNANPNNSNRNNNNNKNLNRLNPSQIVESKVEKNFRCNLFESVPYEDILSAVNSLNQAVNSPSCGGSKVNVQSIVENNKLIEDIVKELRNFKDNPETVQPGNAPDIVNKVDAAIRAATTIANSFAQSDLLTKECRQSMSAGGVAIAINDLINGLIPYALMAAPFTGGTSVIPFIVGGQVITGAVSSMAKIIGENDVNVNDAQVRRAIVENTCQYIRLDQRYKFLIKSRQEQIGRITEDISASQRLFSAKVGKLSGDTNGLLTRKSSLDSVALDINAKISSVRSELELDKQFMKMTSDDIKICQLGVQLTVLAQNKSSYVSTMLSTLDEALIAYGNSSIAQAQALKMSANIAVKNLQMVATTQFSEKIDFAQCASVTRSFVETIEQSASLAKQLVKISQEQIEKGLQSNKEYSLFRARLTTLNQKQYQAERVTQSLENLKAHATAISQSEIDSEMARLRRGLFQSRFIGASSPVLKWFSYVKGLHVGEIKRFQEGLQALRVRAYRMRASITADMSTFPGTYQVNKKQIQKEQAEARDLLAFNLKELPLGTQEHAGVCRELNDVWNRWTVAIDHLAAMDSFCGMIEPYVFDTRPEDRELVMMCRGYTQASATVGAMGASLSVIASLKDGLVKSGQRDWALFLKKKMESLVCLDSNN